MLAAYAQNGHMLKARAMFDSIPSPGIISWNIMIQVYGKEGLTEQALKIFHSMLHRDTYSWNSLVAAFAQKGDLERARVVFDRMPEQSVVTDAVTETAMVYGYAQAGHLAVSSAIFESMKEKDSVAWNVMIVAYAQNGFLAEAAEVFDRAPRRDVACWNSMITANAKNGDLERAIAMFERIPSRDCASWAVMISGLGQSGLSRDARRVFSSLDLEGWRPDEAVMAGMIESCCDAAGIASARECAAELGLESRPAIAIALVNAYAKSGFLETAAAVFFHGITAARDVVAWTTMITATAQAGHGGAARELFQSMQLHGIKPNSVTYLNILCACSYAGLVIDACCYLRSSIGDYWIAPKMDHFVCLVDILGRAGMIAEAEEALCGMPYEADSIAWLTMLAACKNHGESRRGTAAAAAIHELEPGAAALYLLSSNMSVEEAHEI
ncbi:hypothetical protein SELMODRAFT_128660 [Selaginella moellendorffii]|uniref:Pentacotripeptide-repeat region of PRORP domain-containing protein n=1 Tax=Selaginella moellendorffii TaxID=88036 RepID=D8SZR2_SELML|nr:hypothetical protein SELMODRAFT_128660 [Selaginella moellendorffii]